MKLLYQLTLILFALCFLDGAQALTYPLPLNDDTLVGHLKIIQTKKNDTLYKIAREQEMGFDELTLANPKLLTSKVLKINTLITIPSLFLLPDVSRSGLVINLPEKRLYYFDPHHQFVVTEPIAIGQYGWPTPAFNGNIVEKIRNPAWNIPKSIQEERRLQGLPDIEFIPPGPENPLGDYALRLSSWSVLIHGTNSINSIGKRASHGCMRMYPEDIEQLFYYAKEKMPVRIINQPYKAGWNNHELYLEIHPSLEETRGSVAERVETIYQLLLKETNNNKKMINWNSVKNTIIEQSGIPRIVGSYNTIGGDSYETF